MVKLVIIGDSGVGKSSLLLRFSDDQFVENYMATIGVDFRFKTLNIDGRRVKYQIWDTAGQERFRTITSAYYKGCHGIVMVYDITNRSSLENLKGFWLSEVESYADKSIELALIGNKIDDEANKKVDSDEADAFAKSKGMPFVEASAKTSDRVKEIFEEMGRRIIRKSPEKKTTTPAKTPSKIEKGALEPKKEKKGCC